MTSYREMNQHAAAAALREFLRERPVALEQLHDVLAADGQDPERLLDGSPQSLTPLWRWAKARLTAKTDAGQQQAHALELPSWLRYTRGQEPILSRDSLEVVDGITSYFCKVVEAGAPEARWRVGYDRVKSYIWQNHPVLGRGEDEFGMVNRVPALARSHLLSTRSDDPAAPPSGDEDLTLAATSLIRTLRGRLRAPTVMGQEEPVVEVEVLEDDDFDFEICVHDQIAHEHSLLVDQLATALERQAGVSEAFREDQERLLLRAPDWTAGRLEAWTSSFLAECLRD
jgi:hypothetical protein